MKPQTRPHSTASHQESDTKPNLNINNAKTQLIIEPLGTHTPPTRTPVAVPPKRALVVVSLPGESGEHHVELEDVEALLAWNDLIRSYPGTENLSHNTCPSSILGAVDTIFHDWLKSI